MKRLTFILTSILALALFSCGEKYPDLEDGLYAEFITNQGTFVAKLYEEQAPLTIANFVSLAEGTNTMVDSTYKGKNFYNGLIFHRVIKDFMIQGGDPEGTGRGGPGYKFPDETTESLAHNDKGILSMANSGPNTNGSQFFVTLKATPWLDGRHTIFGKVMIGQEVVDTIGKVETTKPGDKPVEDVSKMLKLNERITSVDTPFAGDSEKALLDVIPDEKGGGPENKLQNSDLKNNIVVWLNELNSKQREVLARRFGLLGYEAATLEDVGSEIGLTRERVRQIQVEALKRLRDMLGQQNLSLESLFQE